MGSLTVTVIGQSGPSNKPPPALPSVLGSGVPVKGLPKAVSSDSSARTFITQAQAYLSEGRALEAKEALRTAIRLESMNLEAWALYDYAAEVHFVGRTREEKINPFIERDLKPLFSIDRVESYQEFRTLYLVGEVRNLSDSLKQQVELSGILLDENKQELRRETGYIKLKDRGLFPNESSLFEIAFPNPPPGIKSFRVRVSGYE